MSPRPKTFPGKDYDLVTVFDCLHDMGDPIGAAAHVRQSLAKDGTWMIVEPFANDHLKDNLNPVGRVYYSFSTLLCTPCSRSQEVGLCLGAQAGETRIREVVTVGRIYPFPPGYGNAFQYRVRGASVSGGLMRSGRRFRLDFRDVSSSARSAHPRPTSSWPRWSAWDCVTRFAACRRAQHPQIVHVPMLLIAVDDAGFRGQAHHRSALDMRALVTDDVWQQAAEGSA